MTPGFLSQLLTGLKNLLTWWVTVAPWEQSVRVRLGKHVRLLRPGVHIRFPILDRIYVQSIRLRSADIPIQTITTKDGHTLTTGGNLLYEIVDVLRLYETLHHAQEALTDMVAAAIAEAVHGFIREECTPTTVQERVSGKLDLARFGINQTSVHITDFAFVKTYRIIKDDKRQGWDDLLNTYQEQRRE